MEGTIVCTGTAHLPSAGWLPGEKRSYTSTKEEARRRSRRVMSKARRELSCSVGNYCECEGAADCERGIIGSISAQNDPMEETVNDGVLCYRIMSSSAGIRRLCILVARLRRVKM